MGESEVEYLIRMRAIYAREVVEEEIKELTYHLERLQSLMDKIGRPERLLEATNHLTHAVMSLEAIVKVAA